MSEANELEKYIIQPEHHKDDSSWRAVVPRWLLDELVFGSFPTLLGKHPDKGWFVLSCSEFGACSTGGLFVVWKEWTSNESI